MQQIIECLPDDLIIQMKLNHPLYVFDKLYFVLNDVNLILILYQ